MAILKTLLYPFNTAAIIEDPTPGADTIFLQNDAFDKNTLAPLFDQGINHDTAGTTITGFGLTNPYQTSNFFGSRLGRIYCDGPVTDVQVTTTVGGNSQANLDAAPWVSMDPTRPFRKIRYDTNGISSTVGMFYQKIAYTEGAPRIDNRGEDYQPFTVICLRQGNGPMAEKIPYSNAAYTAYNTPGAPARTLGAWYPVYMNNNTGNMVVNCYMNESNFDSNGGTGADSLPGWAYGGRLDNYYATATPTLTRPGSNAGHYKSQQFIGVDSGGRALFFYNDYINDYTHTVTRYIDVDNTFSVLFNNSTAPAASGTSAGGNRGTAFGNYAPKYSSVTFEDPISNGNRAWYTPFFDVNGKYHPMYFQWNTTTDAFTRNTDIIVNWGATNQDAVWQPDLLSGDARARWGCQRAWWNETWTVTTGGVTTRYLMLMQLHGSGTVFDTIPRNRTFVVFAIDAVNPKSMTYHSSIIIPTTPKNIIFLNAAKTQMGVFCETNFYTYSFNAGSGWVLSGTVPYKFASVGVDSRGRIWALAAGPTRNGEVHLITLNVPVTISVVAPQTQYNFQGSNINSNLIVNAFDTTGNRISVPVKLVIDGGAMTFSGANLTTIVTTNTATNTIVSTIITGAGVSNIIASVVL